MLMGVAAVFWCLFFQGFQDCLPLSLGEQFCWFSFALVRETRYSFFQVSILEINRMRAGESGERLHVATTTPLIREQYRLCAPHLTRGGCRLYECSQFRNLLVIEPFYI